MHVLDHEAVGVETGEGRSLDAHPAAGYTVSLNLASVIGQRLHVFQAMWLREMQRAVEVHSA